MKITFKQKGDFSKTKKYMEKLREFALTGKLNKYGEMGVKALQSATPVRTGTTASSWGYTIETSGDEISIHWTNSNINKRVNIALLLQYGHGTGTGGYVQGIDYINPALKPVFDSIVEDIWREVKGL